MKKPVLEDYYIKYNGMLSTDYLSYIMDVAKYHRYIERIKTRRDNLVKVLNKYKYK